MGDKISKNLIVAGVLASESVDTSGERLSVKGADISELQSGRAPLNTEHINPEDLKDILKDNTNKDFAGFSTIIGRVVSAKKIFSKEDCDNDMEIKSWVNLQTPFIWGVVEIFDDPGHPNAQAAASIIRQYNHAGLEPIIGFSVEGSTLSRKGNLLEHTMIRSIAATRKPCNKAALIQTILDPSQTPKVSKSDVLQTVSGENGMLLKSEPISLMYVLPANDAGLASAYFRLKKALAAGYPAASPSSLSGGEALQKESQLAKLIKLVGKKLPSRDDIKKALPEASDEMVHKADDIIKEYVLKKHIAHAEEIYKSIFKN